jgi:ketosteroid isomerase-like protein
MGWKNCIAALFLSAGLVVAQGPGDAKAEVETVVQEFMRALNALEWPAFRQCWTERPFLFHPTSPPLRIDDQAAFDTTWQQTFEGIRKGAQARGITQAPFMRLTAADLRIDLLAADAALATFHLSAPNSVGRRTMVLVKTPQGWKITHLHASNMPKPPE